MIRHEHVQHLSRTDSIDQLHAKLSFPLFTKMRRQRFTRRHAQTQTRAIELAAATVILEQQVVDHRNSEKDRRTLILKQSGDQIRRRLLTTENRCCSVQEWKRETVSQTISKGQSR